jgi:hypothetical protein
MKRTDDHELIAALVDRIGGGRLEPRELAGALEGAGFRLELKATLTKTTTTAHLAVWRAEALAELERHSSRAARCEVYLARPRRGSFGTSTPQCAGATIVAAVVERAFNGSPRYRFVCGRHLRAHGVAPTDLLGVIHLTPRELERPRQLERERNAAAERRRDEEEAASFRRALTVECPTCKAPPESRCGGRGGLHTTPHYDRVQVAAEALEAAPAGGT